MLSVHGRREDGFHDLTSIVAATRFGDVLGVTLNTAGADKLVCDDERVPLDASNLVLRAAKAFREATGSGQHFNFDLKKRIPMGAGLGGGSSNAAIALRGMNTLLESPLSDAALEGIASDLGSDCAFFIRGAPAIMSGRGECLKALPEHLMEALRGRRIFLFKPDFGIETAGAYRALAEKAPGSYASTDRAQARIDDFTCSGRLEALLFNSFEISVGAKYLPIACLLELLREKGFNCLMSGSGSCCFAPVQSSTEAAAIRAHCESAFGPGIFFIETSLL